MRPFAALERFFERLFERPSARLFHARLQPIQLQRRVERAMENGRLSAADRVVVPNRYVVRLATADLHAYGDFADSLELELADAALKFARAHHYAVADRPAVHMIADATVAEGDARVEATFSDAPFDESVDPAAAIADWPPVASFPAPDASRGSGEGPTPGPPPFARPASAASAGPAAEAAPIAAPVRPAARASVGDGPPAGPGAGHVNASAPGVVAPAAASGDVPGDSAGGSPAANAAAGIRSVGHPRGAMDREHPDTASPATNPPVSATPRPAAGPPSPAPPPPLPVALRPRRQAGLDRIDATQTMIFQVPTVDAPQVVLREVAPDGSQRALTLDGGPVTIGRATDNNLVLRDSRVSRYHGRLAARQGALVYRDLGSTNGSRVNGIEIDEVVLGAGDRIEVGDTVLVVESVAGA